MLRLKLQHNMVLFYCLGIIPFIAMDEPARPAEPRPTAGQAVHLRYPADHPLVQLLLKARKARVHLYLGPDALKGPDDEGNYRVAPPDQVHSVHVYTYSSQQAEVLKATDIAILAEHFPHIEYLHLETAGTSLWASELQHFSNLESLDVRLNPPRQKPNEDSNLPPWTPELHKRVSATLFDQLRHLPQLQKLTLNSEYREESIKKLRCLKNLRELRLIDFQRRFSTYEENFIVPDHNFTAETWSRTIAELRHLETIDMGYCQLRGPIDWAAVARLPNLDTLLLAATGLNDKQLAGIEQLEHLKVLDLSGNPITGRSLAGISQLKSLEILELEETAVGDNILALTNLPNLKRVDYPGKTLANTRLSAAELEVVLRTCTRDTVGVEDPESVPLGRMSELFAGGIESLNISDAKDPPTMRLLGTRMLLLRQRPLTMHDLDGIEHLDTVRQLNITTGPDSDIDHQMLARLFQMPSLDSLVIDLGSPRRNAEVLPLLAEHPTLGRVHLTEVLLDVDAARQVASIPNLRSLSINDSRVHTAAWSVLAKANKLEALDLAYEVFVEGHPGERFRGIEQIASLKSLTAGARLGNDHECRWIGHCKNLESLTLDGTFSDTGLARLAPMPELEKLYLRGSVTVTEDGLAVLGHNPKLERVAITNTVGNPDKNVYSEMLTREYEIGFAGACSCGCMDTEPPEARILKPDEFVIEEGRLIVQPAVLAQLDRTYEEIDEPWNGKLRIAVAIRGEQLTISRSNLPKRLRQLYLNDTRVERLDFVNCWPQEIGVFGNSQVGSLHFLESSDDAAERFGQKADSHATTLYLGNVNELTVHSSCSLTGLTLYECRSLQSLHLEGAFPNLSKLQVRKAMQLRYLAAPYSGSAPKLEIGFFSRNQPPPRLRLLKAPGVVSPGIDQLLGDSRPHPPLYEVDLRQSEINDEQLLLLAQVPTLRILRIADCRNLTPAGIESFRSARPDVSIR